MVRSAIGVTVSVSVAVSLPVVGSAMPAGVATVAVFVTLPLVAVTFAVTVISKNWPEASVGRLKPPALSSWPLVGVVPTVHWPGVAEQATVVFDRPAAAASFRIAPATLLGPLLVARIV